MCTSPIRITKFYPALRSTKQYFVPCGHCEECRSKYQAEFACLSCLAAEQSGSMHFLTFTYNNQTCPVLSTYFLNGSAYRFDFSRGIVSELIGDKNECQPYFVGDESEGVVHCPSLYREDIKKVFKRFREAYFRENGERLKFSFSFFGEYGDRRYRPHYHGVVFGLSDLQAQALADIWRKSFGFVDCRPIPFLNADGSPAYVKVSRYVSKYIAKRDMLPSFVQMGFAELPRRQSSIGLGRNFSLADIDRYKNFT